MIQINVNEIKTLASDGGYAGTYTLTDESACLILALLTAVDPPAGLRSWTNDTGDLTDADIDTIDNLVATAIGELTT